MAGSPQSRRDFFKLAAAKAASQTTLGRALAAGGGRPPNFIVILADDMGFGDLGYTGSKIKTPESDDLAKEGAIFNAFYAANSVCSPSRAGLLTARHGARYGIPTVLGPNDTNGLPASEITIPQMLKPAGYDSMIVGKWHLGLGECAPTNRGFDWFFGVPFSNDMGRLPLMWNTTVLEENTSNDLLTQRYTRVAVDFINAKVAEEKSFFLYLAHNVPHIPLGASPAFRGRSKLGAYGDAIQEFDWSVGEIKKALLKGGVEGNTIVIVTSDNGPWYQGSPGRLRGRKGETWEGGLRAPCVAWMPGTIPAGLQCPGVGSLFDLFPTFAGLAGMPLPAVRMDGVDIWPILTGKEQSPDPRLLLYFNHVNMQCARFGDWKLHMSRYDTLPLVLPSGKGPIDLPLKPELYNLKEDPEEAYDCSDDYPDVVKEIRARAEAELLSFPDEVRAAYSATHALPTIPTPAGALPIPGGPP